MIKSALSAQALSLRKFSELCGISPSSLSRILSNKQTASFHHLQLFSKYLNIPLEHLIKASGIIMDEGVNESSRLILNIICEILKSYEIELDKVVLDIRKELKKYEQYAKTAAGNEAIKNGFLPKINELGGEGIIIVRLQKLYQLFCSDNIEPHVQSVVGSALLYLILTPDVIPDYAFPVGYLDDAIAIVLTVNRLSDEFNISL